MTEEQLQTMERYIKLWKSGSDVMAVWKKQPVPEDKRRDMPHPAPTWTPPSEDPYYLRKWAFYKSLAAKASENDLIN